MTGSSPPLYSKCKTIMLQASNTRWSTQESKHCIRKEKKPSLPDYHYLRCQILSPSVASLLSSHVSNGFLSLPSHTFTFLAFLCPEVLLTSSHSSFHSPSTPKSLQSFIEPFLEMGRNILIVCGLIRTILFVKKLRSPSSSDILVKPSQDPGHIGVAPSSQQPALTSWGGAETSGLFSLPLVQLVFLGFCIPDWVTDLSLSSQGFTGLLWAPPKRAASCCILL